MQCAPHGFIQNWDIFRHCVFGELIRVIVNVTLTKISKLKDQGGICCKSHFLYFSDPFVIFSGQLGFMMTWFYFCNCDIFVGYMSKRIFEMTSNANFLFRSPALCIFMWPMLHATLIRQKEAACSPIIARLICRICNVCRNKVGEFRPLSAIHSCELGWLVCSFQNFSLLGQNSCKFFFLHIEGVVCSAFVVFCLSALLLYILR